MTYPDSQKYYARLEMDNFVITFVAIDKTTRQLERLFMNPMRELTKDPRAAAYFSDTASASTFLKALGTDLPKIPDNYELIPHSSFYDKVTVVYKYPRKRPEDDKYIVEMEYHFWKDNPTKRVSSFDAAGNPITRVLDNAQRL